MKKNLNKIVIGISVLVAIGIGSLIILNNNKETKPEEVVKVTETVEVPKEETKVVEEVLPEEEASEPEEKEFLVMKKDYWNEASPLPTKVAVKEESTEVASEVENNVVVEEPVVENNVIVEEPVAEEMKAITTGTETTVASSSPDFSSSANLQAVKASADAQIHTECGGGNEGTGFILTPDCAYITYFGKIADDICRISYNDSTVVLVVNAELNDMAWNCMSAAMSEIFANGSTLIAECRKDCESSNTKYGAENEWVIIDGVSTTIDILSPEDLGAAGLGSIVYTFKR